MRTHLTFIILTIFLLSCSQEKKLIIPLRTEISTLDPHQSYDMISNTITYQVYESLYTYQYLQRPYQIQPLIAKGLPQVSKDNKTYTIKIKPNIRYHNKSFLPANRSVKAQDIITSLKRLAFIETKSRGWFLYQNKIQGLDSFRNKVKSFSEIFKTEVDGLKAINEHTLQVQLNEPLTLQQFLNLFSLNFTTPLPEEGLRYLENDLESQTLGTGAYYLEKTDSYPILLKKFEQYQTIQYPSEGDRFANENQLLKDAGKSLPFIQTIELPVIKDALERWKQLIASKTHMTDLPSEIFNQVINLTGQLNPQFQNKGLKVFAASSMAYWWIEFNMDDPIVGSNQLLRQAIAHAIDRDKYIEIFTNNTDQVANSLFLPGIMGYNPSHEFPFRYDLEKAKLLLAKAGYPNGENMPVLNFETRRDNDQHKEMAIFIKESLEKIGIKVEYTLNTFSDFINKSKNSEMQMWHGGWLMDYPDPENILQLLYSKNKHGKGPNKSNYNNPQFDILFEQYLKTETEEEKIKILKNIEVIISQDLPWIILNYSKNYFIYSDEISNFRPNELIPSYFKFLRMN